MQCVTLHNLRLLFLHNFPSSISSALHRFISASVILGATAVEKSALAACIAGQGEFLSGERQSCGQLCWVSVEQQQALIEAETGKKTVADINWISSQCQAKVEEILFAALACPTRS